MCTSKFHWLRPVRTRLVTIAVATAAIFFMPLANASGYDDFDARAGAIEPDATQLGIVSSLGANASWSQFGTPSSLLKYGGYLATGLSGPDAATVARNWVDANKALFRLSSVDNLKVMSDGSFPWSEVHAVTFRQEIAGLRTAEDGTLTVGIVGNAIDGWKIGYVSASTTADSSMSGDFALSAADAYVAAAQNIGRQIQISDIGNVKMDGEWSAFSVTGLGEPQRARMRALPTPSNGVRPVYETIYIESADAAPRAYLHYIDAEDGTVWMRKDIVEHSHPAFEAFAGELPDDASCDDAGPWDATGETVGSVIATVTADFPVDDATIAVIRDGEEVAFFDSGFSPEAVTYTPPDDGGGVYHVRVCDFNGDGSSNTWLLGYTGTVTFLEQDVNTEGIPQPQWKVFPANPFFKGHAQANDDTRDLWCWDAGNPINPANPPNPNCDLDVGNVWSRVPWDYDANINVPTFTTRGNNAFSSLSESPLTPSAPYQPIAEDRDYSYAWENTWGVNACEILVSKTDSDGSLGPDADEAVVNLFAMHNRAHDWSYALGFTERRWNAQSSNFGNDGPGTLGNDPVIGNAQAGGLAGGWPGYVGRDNANMITLPDGVSPITNMYLWQPIAGAFYAPCADGDFDAAIIFHEYGHMTENRMIGKGGTRSGHHAGAMGESFGDFSAAEYLNEYSTVPLTMNADDDPFALAGFSTGNGVRGIRNYNMNSPRTGAFPTPGFSTTGSGAGQGTLVNPLNFSNIGYDLTGAQVHADGEIWSATNMSVRQELVAKYNAFGYLESDTVLQAECADGLRSPSECPGNRRWIQTVFDAMLLMPGNTSMLQARDAYLAADLMRYDNDFIPGNTNQREIWRAFAHRGMGCGTVENAGDPLEGCTKNGAESGNNANPTKPDFQSPLENNAIVTFAAVDEGGNFVKDVDIYVGHFEARVSTIAVTGDDDVAEEVAGKAGDKNDDNVAGFAPGPYEFVARADGYGHFRFAQTFGAGETKTLTITMPTNYASGDSGGSIAGATAPGSGQTGALIDDTEHTNYDWFVNNSAVDVVQPQVTVALDGPKTINRAQVSAMLLSQNRFTALREFKLQTSTDGLAFDDWIDSGAHAFPGHTPRPVSPEMILRGWDGEERANVTHVRIIALDNQCTGNELFHDDGDPGTVDHDNDPNNTTDCRTGVPGANTPVIVVGEEVVLAGRNDEVHIAELQVFGAEGDVECTAGDCDNGGGNLPPVANDDMETVQAGGMKTFDVRLNDTDDNDVPGDLTVMIVANPSNGMVQVLPSGEVKYTHTGPGMTSDLFTYKVTDTDGAMSNVAEVHITITDDPDPENECAEDTDSDSHDCRTKGSGKLNDGNDMDDDSDSDKFTIEAKQKGANDDDTPKVSGKLYVDTDNPKRKVRGEPTAQFINGNTSIVTGTCEYEFEDTGKVPCTFEVNVTEPDQFGVTIRNLANMVLYQYSKQTIIDGEIEVRSDGEYE